MSERNLRLNPKKRHFFKPEVLFLGHVCSEDGIKPDASKFNMVRDYPIPQNADDVKRLVAFSNCCRKFILNFSIISFSLNELTKKNVVLIGLLVANGLLMHWKIVYVVQKFWAILIIKENLFLRWMHLDWV